MTPLPRCFIGVVAVLLFVTGCAVSRDLQPGASVDEVLARRGTPWASYQLPAGQRLLYSPQPGQVQSFDFDATGRLVRTEQALTRSKFGSIMPGQWRATELQQTFGPPARRAVDGDKGSVWTYFFREYGVYWLARIHLDAAGLVGRIDFAEDPAADDRYR
jgi:hypothetical protein